MTPKQLTETRAAYRHTLNNAARLLDVPRTPLRRWETEGIRLPIAPETKTRHGAEDLSAGVIERCVVTALKHHQALKHVLALAREQEDRKIPCPPEAKTSMTKEELRALRKSLRMTQVEFAAHLGLVHETISRWERGTLPVNVKLLRRRLEAKQTASADQQLAQRAFAVMIACVDVATKSGYTMPEFHAALLRARRSNLSYAQLEAMFTLLPRKTDAAC